MPHTRLSNEEIAKQGQEIYKTRLAFQVETEENTGKIIVIDVETGDYELDTVGMNASKRLRAKHPDAALFALRIGYEAVESFGGVRLRHTVSALAW